ncbi:ABC-F family ATP-binding cassette domain-containing protein [soil metagenome]
MFDVQNVSLYFGEREILRDASFKVEDGERAAIIGPNGMGKSTLIKIVAGLIKPERGTVAFANNTEIGYLPQDLELNSERTVLDECKQVFEDVLAHETEMREIEEQMSHVPHGTPEFDVIADRYEHLMHETQRRDLYTMDSTISKVLGGLGFKPKDLSRFCKEFSGGWQMRILLAKLLLQNPDVLLLDEPTNHLDIESIEWLADWIKGHEGSVLMVSHERAFMDALVSKVVEVDRGDLIIYRGNYSESLIKRKERRENQQRAYDNQQREMAHIQVFIDRFRYQAAKAAMVQSRVKALEKMEVINAPTADLGTINFTFPPAPRSSKEVMVAEHITKSYGKNVIVNNVDITVYRGEKIALVGVNGAGKTTLMRILSGRDSEFEGEIKMGSNVDLAYFAQYDKEDLHPDNTVLGEFSSAAPLAISNKARSILGAFLFSGDDVEKKIKVLSGGERTRLRLAKMLCGKANLLMLDEPTNHLDIGSRLTLEHALKQYDGAVVLVSHDRYFLDNVVNRVIEIRDGIARSYQGNYADYLLMREMQENAAAKNAGGTAERAAAKAAAAAKGPSLSVGGNNGNVSGGSVRESESERRERQEREKKSKNRLRKAEQELKEHEDLMYELERGIETLENELAVPAVASDYPKAAAVTEKLNKVRSRKDEIESVWMGLQEEVEMLTAELA